MKQLAKIAFISLLSLLTSCSLGQRAAQVPCHPDLVQTSPGIILPLASGQTYQVFATDNHVSMLWLPLDKLAVCPIGGSAVAITDLSRKDEKIRAILIPDTTWLNLQNQED